MHILISLLLVHLGVSLTPQQGNKRVVESSTRQATRVEVRLEEFTQVSATTTKKKIKNRQQPLALKRLESLPKQTVWTEFGALAAELGKSVCNLGQGFPDWAPPPFAAQALLNVAEPESPVSAHQYARSAGLPALCEVLARRYSRHFNRDIDPATEIAVTVGATQALLVSLMSIIEAPGDEIILLEPCFDLYWGQVRLAGGTPKPVALRADTEHGLRLDLSALHHALFTAKALVVNSPHNPSGKVFTQSELEAIAQLVADENERRREANISPVYLISDEVYKYIVHDPSVSHVHLASLRAIQDVTLTVSSAGKTFSATGWQIGWIVGPRHLLKHAHRILPYLQFCAATPIQTALVSALDAADLPYRGHDSYYDWLRIEYARKRNILFNALNEANLPTLPASGGFFLLADMQMYTNYIPPHYFESEDNAPSVSADWAFCRWIARDFGIIAIPASPFFDAAKPAADDPGLSQRLVRFAFCKSDDVLKDAASRLRRLHSTLTTVV
eukprot:CAMPEP_0197318298 /NCGR_PEP_ID=MMETSP0891-20130614/50374_1 /TAXON_ID=44058 ORGANISM="Aureoumbra lagunensis, Strain CCMP1510" /NCGR_SAMPLE_ID=MMETSP0891 /ASSEMBLY_ACC=CAM_ASM_000534 /LENGTH=501 /DNA_ID=CAMNT_0042808665 /DNA_START=1 /DNA_END=1506 /DNA_ORIENTATION=-